MTVNPTYKVHERIMQTVVELTEEEHDFRRMRERRK